MTEVPDLEELAGVGSWTWDPANMTTTWSRGLRVLLQFELDAPAETERFMERIPISHRESAMEFASSAVAEGHSYTNEFPMDLPTGRIWVRAAGRPRGDGSYAGTVTLVSREAQDPLHRTFEEVERRLQDPRRLNAVQSTLSRPVPELVHVLIRALAAQVDTAFAAVTILDDTHQHFLSTNMGEMPSCEVGGSKCQYVIGTGQMVAINNVYASSFWRRILGGLMPTGEPLIAYLGVPLTNADDESLGAVCVVDSKPRVWTAEEHFAVFETSKLIREVLIRDATTA